MCLSVPAKVLSIEGDMAKVAVGETICNASLQIVEGIQVGDYLLNKLLVILVPMINTVLHKFTKGWLPLADLRRVINQCKTDVDPALVNFDMPTF